MVAAVFRTIFAQPDPDSMATSWDKVRDELAARYPKIGPLMDDAKAEVLAFAAFPRAHWRKIWSTNPLERLNKEIKRRSRVVGDLPERGRRHPPRRRRPGRHPRRMAHRRTPLPLRSIHGAAVPRPRYWTRRRHRQRRIGIEDHLKAHHPRDSHQCGEVARAADVSVTTELQVTNRTLLVCPDTEKGRAGRRRAVGVRARGRRPLAASGRGTVRSASPCRRSRTSTSARSCTGSRTRPPRTASPSCSPTCATGRPTRSAPSPTPSSQGDPAMAAPELRSGPLFPEQTSSPAVTAPPVAPRSSSSTSPRRSSRPWRTCRGTSALPGAGAATWARRRRVRRSRPGVVGQHRLGPRAVAGVSAVAALGRVLVVADVLGHLLL